MTERAADEYAKKSAHTGAFLDGIVRPAIFSIIYECAKLKLVDLIDFLFVTYYNKGVVYAKFEQICLMARRESQR